MEKIRFGRIVNGKGVVEFTMGDMAFFYEQKMAEECPAGWKPVETVKPYPIPDAGRKIAFRVTDTGDSLRKEGFLVDASKSFAPRKFSKLKIYGAIAQVGAWDAIRAWLEGKNVDGINGWMAFQLAQEISEDHPLFESLAEEARLLVGMSREQFDALLDACVLD